MENIYNHVICCDWGTSSFRLHLVEIKSGDIKASVSSGSGIRDLNRSLLEKTPEPTKSQRIAFFLEHLQPPIQKLSTQAKQDLVSFPIIISGMASSSIGLQELAYSSLPFNLRGEEAFVHKIPAEKDFDNPIYLISGVSSARDVMRGEETQLVGLFSNDFFPQARVQCILPGTHSKHIAMNNGYMEEFFTFMTGELFNLMMDYSILKNDLGKKPDLDDDLTRELFQTGVKAALNSNILHDLFTVRSYRLFGKYTPEENYYYLSGLLVGAELKDLRRDIPVYLAAGENLHNFYKWGLEAMDELQEYEVIHPADVERAAIYGQLTIYQKNKNNG